MLRQIKLYDNYALFSLRLLLCAFFDHRARLEGLRSAAEARQSSLEESLLSLGQFEEAYEELWAWLTDAVRQLEDADPITGDPDTVAAQLARHKVSDYCFIDEISWNR